MTLLRSVMYRTAVYALELNTSGCTVLITSPAAKCACVCVRVCVIFPYLARFLCLLMAYMTGHETYIAVPHHRGGVWRVCVGSKVCACVCLSAGERVDSNTQLLLLTHFPSMLTFLHFLHCIHLLRSLRL